MIPAIQETAEIEKVSAEERLKSENARIATDEKVAIAEENKDSEDFEATTPLMKKIQKKTVVFLLVVVRDLQMFQLQQMMLLVRV